MAQYKGQFKKKEVKDVIQPTRKGHLGSEPVVLQHNPGTGRYQMNVGNELLFSSVSYRACLKTAKDKGVVWDKGNENLR